MNKICFDANELKSRFLFGLELVDKLGNPFPDEAIQQEIDIAIDEFENFMGIRLGQIVFLSNPTSDKKLGYDYDELLPEMNVYNHETGYGTGLYFFKKKLPFTPVISLQRFAWKLGRPEDVDALNFPIQWCKVKPKSGLIQVRPIPGVSLDIALLSLTFGAFYLPLITNYHNVIPGMLEVDYTCGYVKKEEAGTVSIDIGSDAVTGVDTEFRNLPPGQLRINFDDDLERCYAVKKVENDTKLYLRENYAGGNNLSGAGFFLVDRSMQGAMTAIQIIGKLATINVLHVIGDAMRIGISSESWSADGESASVSYTAGVENATFGARMVQYKKELYGDATRPGLIEDWRDAEKGIQAVFI